MGLARAWPLFNVGSGRRFPDLTQAPSREAVRAIFSPALPDIGSFRMTRRPV
jgi:hypothetical protein